MKLSRSIIVSTLLVLFSFEFCHAQENEIKEYSKKADFYLINKEGKHVEMLDFRGKVLFVIFAASWSQDFFDDFDEIKNLQKEFMGKDVTFLFVVADVLNNWESFINENGVRPEQTIRYTYKLPNTSPKCEKCFVSEHFNQDNIPSYYVFTKRGETLGLELPSPKENKGIKKLLTGAKSMKYK
ncbi:redoxin domain-containing protein [Flammeovirga sp. SubArs3]|uniref:TlpA family protein disulfide reductase n=1 Tax=Flammeovirga sp. SubArs3 TaxID=2995316 RepID=UPI00248AF63F|nr:redoxin domain-containing protein [Flammeovirga sp. SubArs3]